MSFPHSHIPANLTKLSFTGLTSYIPVDLGVSEDTPIEEICWDRWQDQLSHRLQIEVGDPWEDQAADGISIRWLCPLELCEGLWEDTHGNRVDFNFKPGHEWLTVPGNSVDLDFSCEVTPDECTTLWQDYQGNIVPINFNKPWATYQGNQVPITFACEGGGETPDYTYFTGYIDSHEGAEFDLTFVETFITRFYGGEQVEFKLNDFTFESFGDLEFGDGAWIGGYTCGVPVFPAYASRVSSGASALVSDNNATLQITSSSGSGTQGANISTTEALDASGTVEISWSASLDPQQWYDNDNTDAAVRFALFFTDNPASITRPTGSWTYSDPCRQPSPPCIIWHQPFDTGQNGFVSYKNSGTGFGTTAFITDTAAYNLHDGTHRLRFIFRPLESSIEIDVYVDSTLVGSGTVPYAPPEKIVPLWHYHNYGNLTPIYSIDSIDIVGCDEFLTTYPMQGMGLIDVREGATLDFGLRTEMAIPLDVYSGETLHPIHLGSDVYLEDVEFYDGAYGRFDLALNLPWEITANAYEGASANALLNTTTTIDFGFYDGATASFILSESELWKFWEGATTELDLETFPGQTFGDLIFPEGAALESDLSTTHSLPINIYSGETFSDFYLATDVYLDGIEAYSGEYSQFDLTLNLPWEITANAYDGAAGDIQIATVDTMRFWAYDGAQAEFDLDTRPSQDLLLLGYEGASATALISVSQTLGIVRAYDGAYAVIPSLDSDQFWRMYEGATLEIGLATETTLPTNGYSGETLAVDLYTRPSEGLGIFRGYEGASLDMTLNIMVSAILYPNVIRAGIDFVCEFDVSTYFDLNNTACCPVKDSHEHIELNDQPPPDEYYHGDKWLFTADLSTLPRFSMDAYEGAYSDIVDKDVYLTFNFFNGEGLEVPTVAPEFTDFRLCYGNFIPDGDAVTVELVSIYDENCEEWPMYDGARMEMVLENNVQDTVNTYEGATMFFDIEHTPEMLLRAYSGEYVRISNPEFEPRAYEGAQANLTFEEPNWRAYEGAFMEMTVTTDYDVEFLERGCLPNEFVPSNENGDPDWDRFNPVPVELDRYVHSILARCF